MAACGDSTVAPAPAPSIEIESLAVTTLFVGDMTQVRARVWHGVAGAEIVWHSSNTDVAWAAPSGRIQAVSPGTVTITARSQGLSDQIVLDVRDLPALYNASEIEYFGEVAFGTEEGGASPVVRKWTSSPRVKVFGQPTGEDLAALERVVGDLNALAPGLQMQVTTEAPTVEAHFVSAEEFSDYESHYAEGNLGYFWVWWNRAQEITHARVLIATEDVTQVVREHLIREELTQVLGLMRDSWTYPESIFYQGWTDTGSYAGIDRTLVEMLYRDDVHPGQSKDQVLELLASLRLDRNDALARLAGSQSAAFPALGVAGSSGGSGGTKR